MTISWRVQQQYFTSSSQNSEHLIRLPPSILPPAQPTRSPALQGNETSPPRASRSKKPKKTSEQTKTREPRTNLWTLEEHQRFLLGLELFRHGPWKEVANVVGTKTTRQTMTHAQKYRQKIVRRQRLAEAIEGMTQAAIPPLPPIDMMARSPAVRTPLPPSFPFDGGVSSPFHHHNHHSAGGHHHHSVGSLPHETTSPYRISHSATSPSEREDAVGAHSTSNEFFFRLP